MTRLNIHGLGFTLFLGLLTALPPLAIDMALPSLPLIQADLQAPQTEAAAAIAISPDRPSLSVLISWRIARVSPTMRRAQSSARSPSGVKPWKRDPRCTSITPRISSSCLMLVDIVGCVTPQASAARPKCRSLASASRSSSLSIKTARLSRETQRIRYRHFLHDRYENPLMDDLAQ